LWRKLPPVLVGETHREKNKLIWPMADGWFLYDFLRDSPSCYPSPLATLHGFRLCQWLPKSWTHGFFKGKPSLENPGFTLFCIFLGGSMDVWFKPHFSNAGFQKMLNPLKSDVYGRKYEEVCRSRSIFLVFVHGSHIFSRWTSRPWRNPLSRSNPDPVSP
jgi:hypothetical protein